MHAKGFFFNSSFKRTRILKSLLRGKAQEKENPESGEESPGGAAKPPSTPQENPHPVRDYRDQMKKAVC